MAKITSLAEIARNRLPKERVRLVPLIGCLFREPNLEKAGLAAEENSEICVVGAHAVLFPSAARRFAASFSAVWRRWSSSLRRLKPHSSMVDCRIVLSSRHVTIRPSAGDEAAGAE
jgi:hypothetical protein